MAPTFPTLLVVEDDLPFAGALTRCLSGLGYRSIVARSGSEALEILEHDTIFVALLLDLHLPDLDGHEIIRRLKHAGRSVPIVVISGTTDMNDVVRAWQGSARTFLRKPIDPVELERVLASLVPLPAEVPNVTPSASSSQLARELLKSQLLAGGDNPPRVGRYRILRAAGRGGMGVVYVAYDEQLERQVALKLLRPGTAGNLIGEARALAQVSHPNVVQVHEIGESEGRPYVAMEYVEGETLERWAPGRSGGEVVDALIAAGRGLAAAHARGVVHGDFKPSNVMVGADGRVRVIDFGLARSLHKIEGVAERALGGTGEFMAPEVAAGSAPTPLSDQFSFARVVDGHDLAWSSAGRNALVRALARDPVSRWPTLPALLDVLRP